MAQPKQYTGEDIQVLEEIEAVRLRPAMYIGGTGKDGYHHLLWEIVDNSIDEVINKHASRVAVTLHSGGKRATVDDNGRGIPSDLVATVKRDGERFEMSFQRGEPVGKLKNLGGARGTGTTVTFRPDEEIFGKLAFDPKVIAERLEAKAYLHGGLEIVFRDETQSPHVEQTFVHDNGIAEYLPRIVAERGKPPVPPNAGLF